MPKNDDTFHALMHQVCAGSEHAAQELFRQYGPSLLHAIRRRLNKKLRSKFDSIDFAQDVWASFFTDLADRQAFNSPAELIAFLTRMAQNKVVDATRQRLTAQKHNLNREQSLDSACFPPEALAAQQPTPSQVVMSQEEWHRFLGSQPLVYQRIFVLLREGKTSTEIAQELGLHARTVRRIVIRAAPGSIS